MNERAPKFFTDADDQRCARVQLAKRDQYAILLADDLDRLAANGVPLNWYFNLNGQRSHGNVKVAIPGDNVRTVARLITSAGKAEQVHHRDRNRLNLCRTNLVVTKGGHATVDAAELLERQNERTDDAE